MCEACSMTRMHVTDVESELGMSREGLVQLALLLGSDYTEGVSGIGIVNAMEVVHAFSGEQGMKQFRDWFETPDSELLLALMKSSSGKGGQEAAEIPGMLQHALRTLSSITI
jgi:5'-3' exonuclease